MTSFIDITDFTFVPSLAYFWIYDCSYIYTYIIGLHSTPCKVIGRRDDNLGSITTSLYVYWPFCTLTWKIDQKPIIYSTFRWDKSFHCITMIKMYTLSHLHKIVEIIFTAGVQDIVRFDHYNSLNQFDVFYWGKSYMLKSGSHYHTSHLVKLLLPNIF